ncbi:hypothetical protein YTPLAS18_19330 [Nitrospira sp.]|nr:hypothetical protein YTPLAS18_19330 [Nitrospira sp.]
MVLLLACSGCSFTFAYRHADWLILWKVDHYFDITTSQRRELSARLAPLLTRHRREALPQYEAALVEVRQRLDRGLTSEDIDWAYGTYDRLRADLFERIVPDGGAFLASIDSRQVRKLERALSRDNRKSIRLIEAPVSERLEKRAEKMLDWLNDWLGSMSADQQTVVRRWSLALPDTQPVWMAYQQHRQEELLTLLHQPRTPESASRELRAMLVYHDQTAPPAYQQSAARLRDAVRDMALAIDHQLTLDQRRFALTKLQTLIDQLRKLQTD